MILIKSLKVVQDYVHTNHFIYELKMKYFMIGNFMKQTIPTYLVYSTKPEIKAVFTKLDILCVAKFSIILIDCDE